VAKRCSQKAAFLFILLVFARELRAQSLLLFPRVISSAQIYTGLAVSNPTSQTASITFTAYLPDGSLLSGTGVTNPVAVNLSPGAQYARLFTEIFGSSAPFNGWVDVSSSTNGVTGFFLNGNTFLTDLDGAAAVKPAPEFILPLAQEDADAKTEITLLNVNDEAAMATLTLYAADGHQVATTDISLPARGLMRQTLSTIFAGSDLGQASHLRVRSNRPLVGHEVAVNLLVPGSTLRRESMMLSGQTTSSSPRYILPQFVSGTGWLSAIGVVNSGSVPQDVTLTARKDDGTLLDIPGNPKQVTLGANGALHTTAQEIFNLPADTLFSGWIEINGPAGFLSSYIAYGNISTPSFGAVAGSDATTASQYQVFSQVAEGNGFYTGLTLVNPGTATANVEFYTLRADGTTVGRSTFTVKPGERTGHLFEELLPASLEQVGGWALLRSSQPIISAVLFGTTNGSALANVPAQIPAADFIPPAQTTGAISGSVLADSSGVADIEITLTGPVTASRSTDALGRYIFSQLPSGDYTISPTRTGAQFAPALRTVTINRQNLDGTDFVVAGITPAAVPSISFVSPNSTFSGNRSLNLRVLGANFTPDSIVGLNNQSLQTSFVSSQELQAIIPASQLTQPATLQLIVQTAPPGGGSSGPVDFVISVAPSDPLIVGQVAVGDFPGGVAVDTTRQATLITNQSGDSVSFLNMDALEVQRKIAVGRSPADVAINKAKDLAVVANPGSNNVSILNLLSNDVVKQIPVGHFPAGVAVNPNTNRALVSNADDDNVSIIDLDSLSVIGQIPVGIRPLNVTIMPESNRAIVTNSGSNTASIIDLNTNTVLTEVKVGQYPRGVAVHSGLNLALVANANSNEVSIIDLAAGTVVSTIKVGTGPTGVAIHQATNNALVTNSGVVGGSTDYSVASSVAVIDLIGRTVSRTIPVGSAAFGLAVDEDNQTAVVANFGSNSVTIIRVPNPLPRIESVSPKTFPVGVDSVTITVTGSGFVPSSVVTLNTLNLPTTFISTTQLKAEMSAAIFEQIVQMHSVRANSVRPRISGQTDPPEFKVGVTNPEPGGGDSPDPADPSVSDLQPQNSVPVLVSISPAEVTAGNGSFTLTLNGNNFNGTSLVNVGGIQYSPTTLSSTSMTVDVPINQLSAGVIQVFVTNPPPGGGSSAAFPLTVNGTAAPVPTIVTVTPASMPLGSGALTITVEGTNYTDKTQATLGPETGTISGNIATFHLTATETANPATLYGVITTPPPGGGSASFVFNILNAAPKITGFSPAQAISGSPSATVQVTGSNFRQDSQITVDGAPIATQFGSATALTGTIPGALLSDPRDVHIGVNNAPPGGGSADGGVLKIIKGNPVPVIASLDPATVYGNRPGQVITIHGGGFFPGSIVQMNGSTVTSTYTDANTISFVLPPTSRSPVTVQVNNPEPGGGTSNVISLSLTFAAPQITSLNPSFGTVGTQITLTVDGSDFADTAVINFGALSIPATFVSNSELLANVSLSTAGTFPVSVTNFGAQTSNSVNFPVAPPPPTLSGIEPNSGVAGTSFNVSISGTNFIPGATSILVGGNGITVTGVSVLTPTSMVAIFNIDPSAATGDRGVTVSTAGGMSPAKTFTVKASPTQLTLTSSSNPSNFGDAVSFSATVRPAGGGSGVPTATVTFKDGSTELGTVALNGGAATLTTSTLAVGSHSITAIYGGDSNFTSSTSAALTQIVNKVSATTTLGSSVNPSSFGQAVTFTAIVNATGGAPSGLVTFSDGSTVLGTTALTNGQATLTISGLAAGQHSITAVYNGDTSFSTSTSAAVLQRVNQAASTTTLSSSANPATFGQSVTFTAVVTSDGGLPGGTITFKDGATTLGTANLGNGVATFNISALTTGGHSITAIYGGDSNFNPSSSAVLIQTVIQAPPAVSLGSSLNPSSFTRAVTFTASVGGSGGVPGGTVTFLDGSTSLGTAVLSSGQATFTTTILAAGQHSITAVYSGDSNFAAATSPPMVQTVNKCDTAIILLSSANPSVNGGTVTFTAVVSASGSPAGTAILSRSAIPTGIASSTAGTNRNIYPRPMAFPALGSSTPTGTVTFKDGSTTLGTAILDGDSLAAFTISTLAAGSHPITAVYDGDINFNGSTSDVLIQTVLGGMALNAEFGNFPLLPEHLGAEGNVNFTVRQHPVACVLLSKLQPERGLKPATTYLLPCANGPQPEFLRASGAMQAKKRWLREQPLRSA
jgi:YVTN family beta-propeller protein